MDCRAMRKMRSTCHQSNTPPRNNGVKGGNSKPEGQTTPRRDGDDWGNDSAPGFIRKIYDIFNDEANKSFCGWGDNGKTVVIRDRIGFEEHILPLYFKHKNLPSFIRQLNNYGFSKMRQDPTNLEFRHPVVWKGNVANLHTVRRKVPVYSNPAAASPRSPSNLIVKVDDRPLAKSKQRQIATNSKLSELEYKQGYADGRMDELAQECQRLRNENSMLWSDHRRLIETQNAMSDNIGHVLSLIYDVYMKAGGKPDSHVAQAMRMGNSGIVSIKNSLQNCQSNQPGAWNKPDTLPEDNERKGERFLPSHDLSINVQTESQLVSWTGGNALHPEPSFALDGGQGGNLSQLSSLPSIYPDVGITSGGGMNGNQTVSTVFNSKGQLDCIDRAPHYRSGKKQKADNVAQTNTTRCAVPGGPLVRQLSVDYVGPGGNESTAVSPEQGTQISRIPSSGYGDNQIAIIPGREGQIRGGVEEQLITGIGSLDSENSLNKVDSIGYQNIAALFDTLPRLSSELSPEGLHIPDDIFNGNGEEGDKSPPSLDDLPP